VLSASGSTTWRVMKPYLVLAFIVAVFTMVSNAQIAPEAMRTLREYAIKVRTDLISQVLQPGKFSSPENGLTMHIADRAANGDLIGLMIHDERDENQIMTYLAEHGRITKQDDGRALLIMRNGHILRQNGRSKPVQIIVFDSYLFDISQFGPKEGARDFKPRERFMSELLYPDPNDAFYKQNVGKFRSELHDRLSNPLYPILFVLIVGVHLGYPRTTRDGRMQSLFIAFSVAAGLRVVGLAGVNMLTKDISGAYVVWGVPLIGIAVTLAMIHYEIRPLSLPKISLNLWGRPRAASPAS
jgi:lipopolysaccharide export system permease protein